MTYYQQLVKCANAAMKEHPRSVVALDAETFAVVATGTKTDILAEHVNQAAAEGRPLAILQKPQRPENWVF